MSTSAITPSTTIPSSAATLASASSSSSLANENTFLQLLIAQLKNQNPDNPMDGTQFVTQLAQFTTLEQQTQSRVDLDTIAKNTTSASTLAVPANSAQPASAQSTT